MQTLSLESLLLIANVSNNSSVTRKVLDLLCFITKIYPITALALFSLWSLVTAITPLQALHQRLAHHNTTGLVLHRLRLMKRQHILICRAVNKINRHFGLILFLEVCFGFVGATNSLMYVFISTKQADWQMAVLSGSILVDMIVRLVLIVVVCDRIPKEVGHFLNSCCKCCSK